MFKKVMFQRTKLVSGRLVRQEIPDLTEFPINMAGEGTQAAGLSHSVPTHAVLGWKGECESENNGSAASSKQFYVPSKR